jgi:integrase
LKTEVKQIKGEWFVVIRKGENIKRHPVKNKATGLKIVAGLEKKLSETQTIPEKIEKSETSQPTKSSAEMTANERAKKRLVELTSGLDLAKFGSIAKRWYEESFQYFKQPTQERYLHILVKWILPKFGKANIDNITRSEIRTFLINIHQSGQSKSSVGLVRDVLSNIFQQARDEELIKDNPTTQILKRLKLEPDKTLKHEPLNIREMKKFLEVTKRYFPQMYELFMIAFYTGMRLGEIIPLEWNDIDFEKREITVNKHFRRELFHTTKTNESRKVRISNDLYAVLQDYWKRHKNSRLFDDNGKYYSQNKVRDNYLKRILEKAGLRHIRFHDIRHTYASLMLSLGEPIHYVQSQLGHKNASMTLDRYGKFIPSNQAQGMDTLEKALQQS